MSYRNRTARIRVEGPDSWETQVVVLEVLDGHNESCAWVKHFLSREDANDVIYLLSRALKESEK